MPPYICCVDHLYMIHTIESLRGSHNDADIENRLHATIIIFELFCLLVEINTILVQLPYWQSYNYNRFQLEELLLFLRSHRPAVHFILMALNAKLRIACRNVYAGNVPERNLEPNHLEIT